MELAKISEKYNLSLDGMTITAEIRYEEKQYVIDFSLNGILFHRATKRRYNLLDRPTDLVNVAIKNFIKLHKAEIDKNEQLKHMVDNYTEVGLDSKIVIFESNDGGPTYRILMTEKKGHYTFDVSNSLNSDTIQFSMDADSFADIFEKFTIYLSSVTHAVEIFKDNINEIKRGEYAQVYSINEK